MRTVSWRGQKINLVTQSVERITIGPKTKKFLQPESIEEGRGLAVGLEEASLELSMMTEFYQRFR